MPKIVYKYFIICCFALFMVSCATYYQKNLKFQNYFESGQIEKAYTQLQSDKKGPKGKNQLLFLFNKGIISAMLGKHQESIEAFTQADHYIEDMLKEPGYEVAALLTNPSIKPYKPEDFEVVMLNFYQALNYIAINDYDAAIVECKRINIKLNQLNDKYKDHKNRYQQDAFAHLVMGLIYDARKDYNNAFIAYRNAVNVYESDYEKNFSITVPEQLKYDLLRTAYRTGFSDQVDFYEKKFNIKYQPQKHDGGELVFLWLNGLGPVKSEWSINFTKVDGQGGWVTFVNDEYGLSFPFFIGGHKDEEKNALASLNFTRVVFPKYLERAPINYSANIKANNATYFLYEAQNINAIAFKTLNDRMLREMANSLLRLTTKKALEKMVQKQNENLGAVVSIANAITEKADTRNWQTLPYSVGYTRMLLPEGENTITLNTNGNNGTKTKDFTFTITKGKTSFFTYHSLESYPLPN